MPRPESQQGRLTRLRHWRTLNETVPRVCFELKRPAAREFNFFSFFPTESCVLKFGRVAGNRSCVSVTHERTVIMLILLAGIFAVHIIGIILLLVATIDNAWWMTDTMATDVWGRWLLQNGKWNFTDLPVGSHYPQDYLQAVQASSILACIFSILGIFVFVAQLFTLDKGKRFTISGVFQFLACLCIMIAASIYTDRFHLDEQDGWYGHCFILAWISFALTLISSITYFVLRKKTA